MVDGVLDGTGCGDGQLCVWEPILRWEMAVWIVRILDGADPASAGESRFADVDGDIWWSAHVERFSDLGVTAGCSLEPRKFCPESPVSREQMAAFLVRAFDLDPAPSAGFEDTSRSFAAADIDALLQAGLTAGCSLEPWKFCPHKPTARAEMAAFLHRAINPER